MYYQHAFENVEDFLHHRAPYLMVDRLVSVDDEQCHTEKQLSGTEHFLTGHFPGAPIMPGAMMQEMSTQTAGILIAARFNPMQDYNTHDPFHNEFALGVLVKVKGARYRGFARPGDLVSTVVTLKEKVGEMFEFIGQVKVGERLIMRNEFQLTNIRSSVLQGTATS